VIEIYTCTNPDCDAQTGVQTWPATRTDPADSTWGDGCSTCGEELNDEPSVDSEDIKAEAAIARWEMDREEGLL
jgi:hypothetical protein